VELSTGERIDAFYFSPDAFSKRTSANTIAEQVGEGLSGSGFLFPAQADNDRIGGARLYYNVLKANLVTISSTCTQLIECLPILTRSRNSSKSFWSGEGEQAARAGSPECVDVARDSKIGSTPRSTGS
jgi:hypothetical protein